MTTDPLAEYRISDVLETVMRAGMALDTARGELCRAYGEAVLFEVGDELVESILDACRVVQSAIAATGELEERQDRADHAAKAGADDDV